MMKEMTSCRHSLLTALFLLSTQLFTKVASIGGSPHSSTHARLTPSGTDGKVDADTHVQTLMRTEPDLSHMRRAAADKGRLKHAKYTAQHTKSEHAAESKKLAKQITHTI